MANKEVQIGESAIVPQETLETAIAPSHQPEVVIPMIQNLQASAAQVFQNTQPTTFFVFGGSVGFSMLLVLKFLMPLLETIVTTGGLLVAAGAVGLGAVKLKAGDAQKPE